MNEYLNLVDILKDCPKRAKLYSPLVGDVRFVAIDEGNAYPIDVESCFSNKRLSFTQQGLSHKGELGECLLFPSKEQRDWSKFKVPDEKFDYSTLKPFDKVLVRSDDKDVWKCGFFSCMDKDWMFCEGSWEQGIPYNDETKHLAVNADKPDKKYIWWED